MEAKTDSKNDASTESWDKNLTCWRVADAPQCLRVEMESEIHLFPYGYFNHAKLSHEGNNDILQIEFQNSIVIAKGKKLEALCGAFERLSVERIRILPKKYETLSENNGTIEDLQIKN